jgi:hypothetical protein
VCQQVAERVRTELAGTTIADLADRCAPPAPLAPRAAPLAASPPALAAAEVA